MRGWVRGAFPVVGVAIGGFALGVVCSRLLLAALFLLPGPGAAEEERGARPRAESFAPLQAKATAREGVRGDGVDEVGGDEAGPSPRAAVPGHGFPFPPCHNPAEGSSRFLWLDPETDRILLVAGKPGTCGTLVSATGLSGRHLPEADRRSLREGQPVRSDAELMAWLEGLAEAAHGPAEPPGSPEAPPVYP